MMNRILDNLTYCHADMKVVDYLLELIPDWHKSINTRHVKFVESYLKYKNQIKLVGIEFAFTDKDMLCIFWRIQRQLFIEFINRSMRDLIKTDKKAPDKFDDFLVWSIKQYRDDWENIYDTIKEKTKIEKDAYQFNLDHGTVRTKDRISKVLNDLKKAKNLELPEKVRNMFTDFENQLAYTEIAKKYNISCEHLMRLILGKNKPRIPSEIGWEKYINKKSFLKIQK